MRKYGVLMIRKKVQNPIFLLTIIILAFLAYTIIFPLGEIIASTFMNVKGTDGFTFEGWKSVFVSDISQALLYSPILQTFQIGIFVSILSLILGSLLAWVVIRTDLKYKKVISFLLILPYMLPSWFNAFVWLIIFKNDRIGGRAGLIQAIFHVSPPDWLSYGAVPIILSLSTHYYIFAFLLVGAALSSINSDVEEGATILGANTWKVLRKITFPLVLPAIVSAFILIFSKSIGSFGVPALLGLPVRYYTLSTMIYSNISTGQQVYGFILSLVLIVSAIVVIYFNQKVISRRNYTTIGGKGSKRKLIRLGKWRLFTHVVIWLFIFCLSILPVLLLGIQTLLLKDGVYRLDNLTLHYWIGQSDPAIGNGILGVLQNERIFSAFKNTVMISFFAASIAAFIGLVIGYLITRNKQKWTFKLMDQLSFLPILIPSIAFSAIYLSMFSKPSLFLPSLYGTMAILVLITVVSELPLTTRTGTSSMIQIGNELEEAASVLGASWRTKFRKIILPLSRKGLLSGFILVFISAMKELDLLIMLVTPKTMTLTTYTFDLQEQGYTQTANAIVFIIVMSIILVYVAVTVFGKTDITKGIGK
ncbi:ABC transporter permease [Lederbergia galactosidilytica]|uniref:ABC transporter permease n=1 Tax=Lederbergia galactosidilytica TaxID=217031 RepID=A0A0Q9YKI9_9BACI|nr:ABC transporter permease [Lederbergia galactosidilytica]